MVAHLPFFWCCASPLQDTHLHSFAGVHCVYSLYQCVYILHQTVKCLLQPFPCFSTASVSIAYPRVSIAYSRISIVFTQRMCLLRTFECLLLTLVVLLLLHSDRVYSLHQSVDCLLQSFYSFYIASVPIAYTSVSIAYTRVYCLLQSFYCFYIASVSIACTRVSGVYSSLSIAFTLRVCLQLTLDYHMLHSIIAYYTMLYKRYHTV